MRHGRRSPCTRVTGSGLSESHYACRSRRRFCPLLPTDSVGGRRLGRVAGAAWVPSPIMPTSLFRLLLVGDGHCLGWHGDRSDPGSLALDWLAAKTRWRGDLLGAHSI